MAKKKAGVSDKGPVVKKVKYIRRGNKYWTVKAATLKEAAEKIHSMKVCSTCGLSVSTTRSDAVGMFFHDVLFIKPDPRLGPSMRVPEIRTLVPWSFLLPKWSGYRKASKGCQKEWRRWRGVVEKHEMTHLQILKDSMRRDFMMPIVNLKRPLKVEEFGERYVKWVKVLTKKQRAFDAKDAKPFWAKFLRPDDC